MGYRAAKATWPWKEDAHMHWVSVGHPVKQERFFVLLGLYKFRFMMEQVLPQNNQLTS